MIPYQQTNDFIEDTTRNGEQSKSRSLVRRRFNNLFMEFPKKKEVEEEKDSYNCLKLSKVDKSLIKMEELEIEIK